MVGRSARALAGGRSAAPPSAAARVCRRAARDPRAERRRVPAWWHHHSRRRHLGPRPCQRLGGACFSVASLRLRRHEAARRTRLAQARAAVARRGQDLGAAGRRPCQARCSPLCSLCGDAAWTRRWARWRWSWWRILRRWWSWRGDECPGGKAAAVVAAVGRRWRTTAWTPEPAPVGGCSAAGRRVGLPMWLCHKSPAPRGVFRVRARARRCR